MISDALDHRAYEATAFGESAHYAAASAGQARMICARTLVDAGWCRNIGQALREIRVRRAPWLDAWAVGHRGAIRSTAEEPAP